MPPTGTALDAEVAKFDALAARWWDPEGPMKPLHRMNPLRTGWIAGRLARHHGRDPAASDALSGLALLDVGCGAGLAIAYRQGLPEELPAGETFDAVIALEVIEHVADHAAFLAALARALKPGGLMFLSTLNRTARSFLMAKLGAEYLLRLLPVGTHEWRMFVTPGELGAGLRRAGLAVADITGMAMDPLTGQWRACRNVSVNYLVMARAR